jgi:hypothetical protein
MLSAFCGARAIDQERGRERGRERVAMGGARARRVVSI